MKTTNRKHWYLLVIMFFSSISVFAQSRIVLKKGAPIENVKEYRIKQDYVSYEQSGSLHDLEIAMIQQIEGENGLIIRFSDDNKPIYNNESVMENPSSNSTAENLNDTIKQESNEPVFYKAPDPKEMFLKGREDARRYYHSSGSTLGGLIAPVVGSVLAVPLSGFGFVIGVVGIPVIAASGSVNMENENVSDRTLLKNKDFVAGYQKQAKNKRLGNAVLGEVVPMGAVIVLSILVLIAFYL